MAKRQIDTMSLICDIVSWKFSPFKYLFIRIRRVKSLSPNG
jgi:hypothetical protein